MNQTATLPSALPGNDTLPPARLSAAQRQSFRDEGFLALPALCTRAELEPIGATLRALFGRRSGRAEGNQLDMLSVDRQPLDPVQPQLVKPSLYAPALLRTALFHRARAIARELLGPEARFSFDHSILKPAGKVAATPWHQDEAHGQDARFHHEQVSFWVPLQDVDERNGCMQYVPRSHLGPVLPHRSPGDDPRIHALECTAGSFDANAAVSQPMAAGGCILHAGRTLHGSVPNRSKADRLAYVLVFRGPPVARGEPVVHAWLETKRTASRERGLRWRVRGGFMVLALRWLRRALASDRRGLWR